MTMPPEPNATCRLDNIQFLALTGDDAGDFLQRQTTQDVAALSPGETTLAGWLDARGRVRSVFRVLRAHDRWLLAMADRSAPALASDLQIYVLRSKVKLSPETDWSALARIGAAENWHGLRTPDVATQDSTFIVEVARDLFHLYGPTGHIGAIADAATAEPRIAIAREIAAGLPSVPAALSQAFTAHMLNLDKLGGIGFAKGCYPGQEVTARTENLGTVKRRALPFRCKTATHIEPGAELVDAAGAPAGRIVRTVRVDADALMLVVVELERRTQPLYLPIEGRPRVEPLPNPFD
jgi:tRNA-modifying protein YgfZ